MAYRILSLDGGGPWALLEVMALIEIYGETKTGHDVLRNFDLVAANSGGSIVMAGLVENLTLAAIRDLLLDEDQVTRIFAPTRNLLDQVLSHTVGFGPKYDTKGKLRAFERLMPSKGALPLSQVTQGITGFGGKDIRLLVIGFDYDRNRSHFFRSTDSGGPGWGKGDASGDVTLAEAVHASTNAPVAFFDAPAEFHSGPGRFWDGGLTGANNPALAATVEALVQKIPPSELRILSLGTGTVALPAPIDPDNPTPYERPTPASGLGTDIKKLVTTILDDPPDAATFIAYAIANAASPNPQDDNTNVVRLNPVISPKKADDGTWTTPDGLTPAQFQTLLNLPMDATTAPELDEIRDLGTHWIAGQVRNQPLRMNLDTLACELGHDTFAKAKAAWLQLAPPV